jgi:hypothetical protein
MVSPGFIRPSAAFRSPAATPSTVLFPAHAASAFTSVTSAFHPVRPKVREMVTCLHATSSSLEADFAHLYSRSSQLSTLFPNLSQGSVESLLISMSGDDDEDVNDLISHFEMLTHEQMKKALDIAKVMLKNKEKEEKVVAKIKEREEEMKAVIGSPPTHVLLRLNGNSVEKIAKLEKEYDFTDVSVKEREEAKKWYNADKPASSRAYGPNCYLRLPSLVQVEPHVNWR